MIREKKTKAVKPDKDKAVKPDEDKMAELARGMTVSEASVRMERFFFPASEGLPAMSIEARNIEEATEMYKKLVQENG